MRDHSEVRTFVGIDAHAKECSIACITVQGEFCREVRVPTRTNDLRQAVKGMEGPVWVMIEASAMALYVVYALESEVDRVIVNETRENRWISMNESKSDPEDARRLARQLRAKEFKAVYCPKRSRQDIRALARLLKKADGDVTRQKNRLKARYRENGIDVSGEGIYDSDNRQSYLGRCTRNHMKFMAEIHFEAVDAAVGSKEKVLRRLCDVLRSRREYKLVKGVPGIGPKNGATMIAVIDEPFRFVTNRKLWKYSGLGLSTPWTGTPDRAHTRPCKSGNRLMKNAAMSAARAAIKGNNRFAVKYRRMLAGGIKNPMAMKTIARGILSTVLAIWKSGIPYREGS